jgi:hypothetical protein
LHCVRASDAFSSLFPSVVRADLPRSVMNSPSPPSTKFPLLWLDDPFRYWLPSLEELWQTDPMARLEQMMADNARELLRNLPPTPFSGRPDLE